MELVYQDIPRIHTAIAEWGSCIVFILILNKKYNSFLTGTITLIFLVIQCLLLSMTGSVSLCLWFPIMMVAAANMFILLRICCNEKLTVITYCTAGAFLISEFTASLEWLLYYYIAYSRGISIQLLKIIMILVIYSGVLFCIYKLEKSVLKRRSELAISKKEMFSVLLLVLVVFVFSNLSFVYPNTPFTSISFYEVFKLRTLIDFAGVIILLAFQIHMKEIIVVTELNALNVTLRNQYTQYMQYQERIEMISIMYHDLKHQIIGLRAEEDEKKRLIWLDNLDNEIEKNKNFIVTGNKVLDAILDGKILVARKHGIELTYVVDGKLLDFMHVMDICTIFGNALDNAIEAEVFEADRSQRLIHVSVSSKNEFIFIKIENYCSYQPQIINGLINTTKTDPANHGYGLKSIRLSIEKYSGVMRVSTKNNWFTINIMIPQPIGGESY
ncbi:MAG TPA: GHKL domain-containing protein [Clostridiales bacterium]|nr:GHKL domain-containing protein [Clostridiales bacterium]